MSKFSAMNKYRRSRWLYLHHMKPFAEIYRMLIYLIHNSYIPYTAEIGDGTEFGYKGIGLVIHANSVIGKQCVIGTNVTIGGGGSSHSQHISEYDPIRRKVPVIGDRVQISTGAKIIGSIVVGDDVVIGANAVVLNDVPSNAVVVGVPAVVKKINGKACK